jgi:hypothetical protein
MAELTTFERDLRNLPISQIPGWGSDLPRERRPGVPKEHSPPSTHTGAHWIHPDEQKPTVKIYQSVERPKLTPVFGTTCPPKGLSGKIRDYAYTLGEGKKRRWLSLMLADRVDVWESRVGEIVNGREGTSPAARNARRVLVIGGALALVAGGIALVAANRRNPRREVSGPMPKQRRRVSRRKAIETPSLSQH